MTRAGRKPQGVELIQQLVGSAHAQQRMRFFLQTLMGECPVAEACEQLGISASRFFAQRTAWLQGALELLEPRSPGRPAKADQPVSHAEAYQLRQRLRELEARAAIVAVEGELARTLPHVVARAESLKKIPRPPRRPRRK